MTITTYFDLGSLARILYVRVMEGSSNISQLASYVSKNKMSQEEADFIIAEYND